LELDPIGLSFFTFIVTNLIHHVSKVKSSRISVFAEANRPGRARWKNDEGRRSKEYARPVYSE
jgi:hypothetical protein